MPMGKCKRDSAYPARTSVDLFLDIEASVAADEEDDGELDEFKQVSDSEEDTPEELETNHHRLQRELEDLHVDESHWASFVARACHRADTLDPALTHGAPSKKDMLWEIGCKLGHEEAAVLSILRCATHPTMPHRSALSAFCIPHLPGRVYVEVMDIKAA
ncbi:unnamed protein product [Cyclocybe aegerita]|uniref:Uncharacterized protein n=1 Tax=Cyclocybe aegerita TaxID=1973307 RepID=A0A8S0WSS2_CYCAE|nr:unnamed protein product [Cyclocybe aegerita]